MAKVLTSLQKQGPEAFKKVFDETDTLNLDDLLTAYEAYWLRFDSAASDHTVYWRATGHEPGPMVMATPRDDLAAQSWLPHSSLIPAALDALADKDPETVANASALLCALLTATTEPPACLEEGEAGKLRCAALVRVCLGDDVGEPPNLPALEVVLQLLTRLRESSSASPCLPALLDAVEADVDRFFASLAGVAAARADFALLAGGWPSPSSPRPAALQAPPPSRRVPQVGADHPGGAFSRAWHLPHVTDLLLLPHTCNALHMRASAILEWAITLTTPSITSTVHTALFADAKVCDRMLASSPNAHLIQLQRGRPPPMRP